MQQSLYSIHPSKPPHRINVEPPVPPTPLLISDMRTTGDRFHTLYKIHFLPFLPATPPANLPRFPRLDFGLCKGPLGGTGLCEALPALDGLNASFGTSGSVWSLISAAIALGADMPSSIWFCSRCALLAFSCTLLNFSSSSVHLMAASSLGLSLFGRSKVAPGV